MVRRKDIMIDGVRSNSHPGKCFLFAPVFILVVIPIYMYTYLHDFYLVWYFEIHTEESFLPATVFSMMLAIPHNTRISLKCMT